MVWLCTSPIKEAKLLCMLKNKTFITGIKIVRLGEQAGQAAASEACWTFSCCESAWQLGREAGCVWERARTERNLSWPQLHFWCCGWPTGEACTWPWGCAFRSRNCRSCRKIWRSCRPSCFPMSAKWANSSNTGELCGHWPSESKNNSCCSTSAFQASCTMSPVTNTTQNYWVLEKVLPI